MGRAKTMQRYNTVTEPLDIQGRLQAWSYHHRGLGRAASDPAEVLCSVVAVYSSHPTVPLSLLCRSAALDADRFHQLEQQREVVRIPAMRGFAECCGGPSLPFGTLLRVLRTLLGKSTGAAVRACSGGVDDDLFV